MNLGNLYYSYYFQIAFVLDTLRNSLSHGGGSVLGGGSRKAKSFHISIDSGGRLTKIHANFFIRVLKILSQPGGLTLSYVCYNIAKCFVFDV